MRALLRIGDYVRERKGKQRQERVVDVIWADYGHIGTDLADYLVEFSNGTHATLAPREVRQIALLEYLAGEAR